jgi:signal transduction histidine kinase
VHLYAVSWGKAPTKLKSIIMFIHTTTRKGTKLRRYQSPFGLFKAATQSEIAKDKPSQYASALAHEVRNPLSNINLAVEMLQSISRDADQQIYLDIILRGSLRINNLVTDLLATCQPLEMKSDGHFVHQLLDEVLSMTQDRIMLKNIMISKDYSTLDCEVLVNRNEMKIALTNIVINAIDAMPSKMGRLTLITKSVNGKCVLKIEDNGIGISKVNLKNIFTPYFTNKPGGMGLGLSTTWNILQSNHVLVDVQSEEGRGTSFMLSFETMSHAGDCLSENPVVAMA